MTLATLYGALAEAICKDTIDRWIFPQPERTASVGDAEPSRAIAGTPISGHALSAFESARHMLWKLGVADAVDQHGRVVQHETYTYRIGVNGAHIAEVVAARARSDISAMPPIDEVIAAWLGCASHFGHVSTRREPIQVHDDLQCVMQELVASGYATGHGAMFGWTDKIGPAMQLNSDWNDENIPHAEICEREEEKDLLAAWRSAPDDVRELARRGDIGGLQVALCNRWVEGKWLPELELGAPITLFGGIGRAERFMGLLLGEHNTATTR